MTLFKSFKTTGEQVKLSWIAFLNSKFFTVNGIENIEIDQVNCSLGKQVIPYVLSAHPLAFNLTDTTNLITIIYPEQLVFDEKINFKDKTF